jgi:hypothetical protein
MFSLMARTLVDELSESSGSQLDVLAGQSVRRLGRRDGARVRTEGDVWLLRRGGADAASTADDSAYDSADRRCDRDESGRERESIARPPYTRRSDVEGERAGRVLDG